MTYKVYRKNNFVEIVDTNNNQVYNYKLADVKINRHDMRNVWYDFYAKGNKIFSKIFLSEIADEAGDPWVQSAFEEFITCNFGKVIIGDSCSGFLSSLKNGTNGNYTVTRTFVGAEGGCTNGGVAIELYNGVTDALISTSYACNGVDGAPGSSIDNPLYVYKVMHSQTGSFNVAVNVIAVNTFPGAAGLTVRDSVGTYTFSATLNPMPSSTKVMVSIDFPKSGADVATYNVSYIDSNTLRIRTYLNGVLSDGVLNNSKVIIEVYP